VLCGLRENLEYVREERLFVAFFFGGAKGRGAEKCEGG
jgi:hypothetical protein